MNIHRNLAASEVEFDALMHQADLIRAYVDITQAMGPSEQLLAFIDYDKSLEVEIGLESFDNFSLSTKHEIVLSKLNPDALEEMAMESLATRLNTMANWAMGAGAVGVLGGIAAFVKTGNPKALVFSGISYAAVAAGTIVYVANNAINGVFPQPAFHKFEQAIQAANKESMLTLKAIPSTFDVADWRAFRASMFHGKSEMTAAWGDTFDRAWEISEIPRVIPDKAGWTVANFQSAVKFIVEAGKEIETLQKPFADKLTKIEQWVKTNESSKDPETKEVVKLISKTIGKQFEAFTDSHDMIEWAGKELKRVAKLFKEEEKK